MTKEENKQLIERYPFLLPTNKCTGMVPEDYDYSYTEMDSMPDGWRKAFGDQMLEEIRDQLLKDYGMYNFRIMQIKEKNGYLNFNASRASREVYNIISRYEQLSKKTCIGCGKPAKYISLWWIRPYCENCAEQLRKRDDFLPIEAYFTDDEDTTDGSGE